jgi:hypothetical protein
MISYKKYWIVVGLVLISSLLSILLLVYSPGNLYCITILLTNILIPVVATRLLLNETQTRFQSGPGATGALIGFATGLLPAAMVIAGSIILIYVKGGERITPYSKLAFATITTSLVAEGVGLILISAFAGLISSILFRRNK